MAKGKKGGKPKKTAVKSGKRKGSARSSSRQLWLLLALLVVLVSILVAVGLLGRLQRWFAPATVSQTTTQHTLSPDRQRLQDVIEAQLGAWGMKWQTLSGTVPGYRVEGKYPNRKARAALQERLQGVAPGLTVTALADSGRLQVQWHDEVLVLLQFGRGGGASKPPPPPVRARLAIIMDDLGRDRDTAQRLLQIDLPVTLAIMPDGPAATAVAELAHRHRREVMIHLPMEPEAYPAVNPGAGALFVDSSAVEIESRMNRYLSQIPYAVGANNHMGSRFTADRAGMAVVIGELKEAGLFFIDSRTTAKSVALDEARQQGLLAGGRDVFLDNVEEVAAIGAEIDKLATLALRRGAAIGICHPHAATLNALREAVPRLRRRGVEIVPVAQLLEAERGD
jgi:hypothetical protein